MLPPSPPRVLHVITTLDRGGAEMQLLRLCRGQRREFRLAVAHLKGGGALAPAFASLGVPPHFLDLRRALDGRAFLRLLRLVRAFRPHLLVTHLFRADLYGTLAALAAGVPVVSHKHNEDLYLRRPWWRALSRVLALRARRVVAVSEGVARFLAREMGLPRGHVVCIPHGVELAPDGPAARPVDLGLPAGSRVVGTVARLTRQKGLDVLLHACARLRRWDERYRCIIVGGGEEEEALRALARRLELEETVHFLGVREDLPALFRAFDVFVLPSRWEGLGVVLLEAMAQGCPVVATRVGGIPEVVADGVTGLLVPPDDPEALARAVHALGEDPAARRRLGAAGRRRVAGAFSAARMIRRTTALYRTCLREGGAT